MVLDRTDAALGQRLYAPETVLVALRDRPAGAGLTDSGLWIEHTTDLPAIFGDVLAVGAVAQDAGIHVGAYVLFTRYAGEVTDEYEDGRKFAVFHYDDLLAEIPRETLVFAANGGGA